MKKIIGAFDIGASGGKFILGIFDEGKFSTSEVYRFVNKPVNLYLTTKDKSPPFTRYTGMIYPSMMR